MRMSKNEFLSWTYSIHHLYLSSEFGINKLYVYIIYLWTGNEGDSKCTVSLDASRRVIVHAGNRKLAMARITSL